MIRALLDTDVILDLVLAREPFVNDAAALYSTAEKPHLLEKYVFLKPRRSHCEMRNY